MNTNTAVVFIIGIIAFMLVYISGMGVYRDSLHKHELVIAEDGAYGVRFEIANPMNRCTFPILASYEWTAQNAEVNGLEICDE